MYSLRGGALGTVEPRALLYALRISTLRAKVILVDFNLAVLTHTAKPPNLIPHQIFQLYGTCTLLLCHFEKA